MKPVPSETWARTKVVHITTVHQPFDVRIFHKQCVSLAQAGLDVTLVQRGDQAETVRGVKICPLPTYRNRFLRMTLGVWRAVSLTMRLKPDIVHFHDVELIWGALLLKLFGAKIIYDVHEDVAKDLEDKAYLPSWSLPPLYFLVQLTEWVAVAAFDRMSAATRSISERFPANRVTLVRNTPILHELSVADSNSFGDRPMQAAYLGGLAAFNGPDMMVQAMEILPPELDAKLVLGGRFPDTELEEKIRAMNGWEKVDFRGWVSRDKIGEIFAQVRCGLVVYQPTPNVIESEPNKFFEFLSAGIPLVASNFPVWKAFVEEYRCGLVVDPLNPQEIADAIEYLLSHPTEAEEMGKRGQEAVLSEYNWSIDSQTLIAAYADLVLPVAKPGGARAPT